MTRVGVTGHQVMPAIAAEYARTKIRQLLSEQPVPLVGFSSLAAGADQVFAHELLALGGMLHAVVPARDYKSTFAENDSVEYSALLRQATDTTTLDFAESTEEAYDAAGAWIVNHCDVLIAVWDGEQARGLGGTGDVVAHARALHIKIAVVWPPGVKRG